MNIQCLFSLLFVLLTVTSANLERQTVDQLESVFMQAFSDIENPRDHSIVDPSGNFIRILGPSQEKFLQELIMEAGRHVLYPPTELKGMQTSEKTPEYFHKTNVRDSSYKGNLTPTNNSEALAKCPQDCPHHKPVCGSDKRAYESECHLLAYNCGKNITISDWENCRGLHYLCPSSCLDINDPVCGPDGKLYHNICVMRKRNCGQLFEAQPLKFCYTAYRESKSFSSCPKDCQDMYEPVCGSDGVIYYNTCFLKMRTCGDQVEPVDMTECAHVPKCPEVCIPLYDPVCGSDGKLYINNCTMLKRNCSNPIQRMPRSFCNDPEKLNGGETN